MEKGWYATGLLEPLWKQFPGGQEALAKAASSNRTSLSAINQGHRRLGPGLASRLAAVLQVSVLELGAPVEAADAQGLTLLQRLEAQDALLAEAIESAAKATRAVTTLRARVTKLEAQLRQQPTAASNQ